MPAEKKPVWEVCVHGKQRQDIKADLIAQAVMMLGRELAIEANPGDDQEEK